MRAWVESALNGRQTMVRFGRTLTGVALVAVAPQMTQAQDRMSVPLFPASMKRVGTIDERYQSFNVEMLEVTGGKFWKRYNGIGKPAAQFAPVASNAGSSDTPAG